MKRMIPILLLALTGCLGQPWTPEAKLLGGRDTFNGTVHALAGLRESGAFTEEQAAEITILIDFGSRCLDRWQAAIELNLPTRGIVNDFNLTLRELVAWRRGAERLVSDGG